MKTHMKTKCKGEPTLILFCTGSYTIMRCKSLDQVKEYRMFIINLLQLLEPIWGI